MGPVKGRFIAVEGIDGAGTTTQSHLLVEGLRARGLKSVYTNEPTSGPIGVLIRQILKGRIVARNPEGHIEGFSPQIMALLFAADRLDHVNTLVNPLVEEGVWVISDRYLYSSLAYQGIGLDPDWILTINRFAPLPDLTVFIDVPVDTALKRLTETRPQKEVFETRDLQEKVRDNYLRLFKELPEHKKVLVSGTKPREEVASRILNTVLSVLA